jgi:hypothetical protein
MSPELTPAPGNRSGLLDAPPFFRAQPLLIFEYFMKQLEQFHDDNQD